MTYLKLCARSVVSFIWFSVIGFISIVFEAGVIVFLTDIWMRGLRQGSGPTTRFWVWGKEGELSSRASFDGLVEEAFLRMKEGLSKKK